MHSRMNGLKAVIFDLDGTLIDSEENYFQADRAFLAEFGIELTREMQKEFSGLGNAPFIAHVQQQFGVAGEPQTLLRRKNESYLRVARKQTRVYPEMKAFLERLEAAGLVLALASGSSPEILDELLETTDLKRFFPVVLSAESPGVKAGKPAPDIFLAAAGALGVAPDQCLVVEDSKYGVEAALRAGMRCIAVPYLLDDPLPEVFHRADLLFRGGQTEFTAEQAFGWTEGFLTATV